MTPRYIFLHTAAFPLDGREHWDVGADEIRRWHIENGWSDIGYHYVVRLDGTVEEGRPESVAGAHVKGANSISLGICFAGHGDHYPLTKLQMRSGLALTLNLCRRYGIPYRHVLGHREVNTLVDIGVVPEFDHKGRSNRTSKTCPGNLVDMDEIRRTLAGGRVGAEIQNLYSL